MDMESLLGVVVTCIKVTISTIYVKVMVRCTGMTVATIRENGEEESKRVKESLGQQIMASRKEDSATVS